MGEPSGYGVVYTLEHVKQEPQRFSETGFLYTDGGGHKDFIHSHIIERAPDTSHTLLMGTVWNDEGIRCKKTLVLERTEMEYSPSFSPGYYTGHKGGGYWLSMSSRRQYRAGVGSHSVLSRNCHMGSLGILDMPSTMQMRTALIKPRNFYTLQDIIGLLGKYAACPLSPHLAIHSTTMLSGVLVWNAKRACGVLKDETLYVEQGSSFLSELPEGGHVKYESPERLTRILLDARRKKANIDRPSPKAKPKLNRPRFRPGPDGWIRD